uniref:Putative secreted protein n=1 Tax=Panstrongylus lignarius TaxID=156445 RepID=A0A224XUE8_9HEMI
MKLYSVLVLFAVLRAVYSVCWTTYYDTEHRGRKNNGCVDGGKCKTLTVPWKAHVHSINTKGGCVRLWEKRGCKGKHLDAYPGSPSHNNLPSLGWGQTWSIGTC